MDIIFTSDLHGQTELYSGLIDLATELKPDIIILGGDLFPKYHAKAMIWDGQLAFAQKEFPAYCTKLASLTNSLVFIWGNDDIRDIAENCVIPNGVINATNKIVTLDNEMVIMGLSYVPETPFLLKDWERLDSDSVKPICSTEYCIVSKNSMMYDIRTFDWLKSNTSIETELCHLGKQIKSRNFLLITHTPPAETDLDELNKSTHVGSRAVEKFIRKTQPVISLHGHIHESFYFSGKYYTNIGNCISINPGQIHHPNLDAVVIKLTGGEIRHYHTNLPSIPTASGNFSLLPPID